MVININPEKDNKAGPDLRRVKFWLEMQEFIKCIYKHTYSIFCGYLLVNILTCTEWPILQLSMASNALNAITGAVGGGKPPTITVDGRQPPTCAVGGGKPPLRQEA